MPDESEDTEPGEEPAEEQDSLGKYRPRENAMFSRKRTCAHAI
jgi:hypothetical protein